MEEKSKSKVAAGVLGILLGCLGIHNFYLGFTVKAVIQLSLTIGGPILSFIINIISIFLNIIPGLGIITGLLGSVFYLCPLAMFIWGVVEGILILSGKIDYDANGTKLVD